MNTPTKPHTVGTQVIVVRSMRVLNNNAAPIVAGKITAKLEPHNGEHRYTIEGSDQLVYFHREIYLTKKTAIAAVGEIRTAEEKRIKDSIALALEAVLYANTAE